MRAEIREALEAKGGVVVQGNNTPSLPVQQQQSAATQRWDRVAAFKKALSLDWANLTIETATELLTLMQSELQEASRIVQQRLGSNNAKTEECHECHKTGLKRWSSCYTVKGRGDLVYNIFFCSPVCDGRYQIKLRGGVIR